MGKATKKDLDRAVKIDKEEIRASRVQAKQNYRMNNAQVDVENSK